MERRPAPRLVADIHQGVYSPGSPLASNPSDFVELNGKFFFVAQDGPGDRELWVTDGSEAGTRRLKDIRPGTASSQPRQLVRLGKHVFFTADDGVHGEELWRTDGTAAGTVLVKDIHPASSAPGPSFLTVFEGKLYFNADDGVHGGELWRSDGTTAGTAMVRNLSPDGTSSNVRSLTAVQGSLYFTNREQKLWKTNGTAASTDFVADVGFATDFTSAHGIVYFFSNLGGRYGLWRSNGTAAGSYQVKDLQGAGVRYAQDLQEINGALFFQEMAPLGGRFLWTSNGTAAGTQRIAPAGTGLTTMDTLTNVSGTLYFAGTDLEHGEELWKLTTAQPRVSFSGTINYKENAPLRLLAPFATTNDADNVRFSGGRLSVVVRQNPSWADRIEIRNQGNNSGQIGVSGRWIRFGGVVIGSYREGLPSSQLIIDLNANATVEATQALLRNVGYRNTSDNPSTKQRRVVVTLTDGSGGISAPLGKTINVIAINDAPKLGLGGQLAYKNNSSSILLAPSATVTDPDSANFYNGLLTVEVTSGAGPSNRLLVGGAYSIKSGQLLRQGTVVGTVLRPGIGWRELSIRFNAQMNAAKVQELVRSLRFCTFENRDLSTRILSFTLTDGDGGTSATRTKTISLSA